MKIRDGYSLRNVLDMYVVLGTGKDAYTPNRIMSVNETGAFLWNILEEGAEPAQLICRMTEEYDVSEETAAKDVDIFLAQLRDKNLLIDEE